MNLPEASHRVCDTVVICLCLLLWFVLKMSIVASVRDHVKPSAASWCRSGIGDSYWTKPNCRLLWCCCQRTRFRDSLSHICIGRHVRRPLWHHCRFVGLPFAVETPRHTQETASNLFLPRCQWESRVGRGCMVRGGEEREPGEYACEGMPALDGAKRCGMWHGRLSRISDEGGSPLSPACVMPTSYSREL